MAVTSYCSKLRFLIFSSLSLKLYSLDYIGVFRSSDFCCRDNPQNALTQQQTTPHAVEDKVLHIYTVLFVEYLIRNRYTVPLTLTGRMSHICDTQLLVMGTDVTNAWHNFNYRRRMSHMCDRQNISFRCLLDHFASCLKDYWQLLLQACSQGGGRVDRPLPPHCQWSTFVSW